MDGIVIDHKSLPIIFFNAAFVAAVLAIAVGFSFPRAGRKALAWFVWLVAALVPLGIVAYCRATELSGPIASAAGFYFSGVFVVVWLVALGFELQPTGGDTGGPQV